MVCYGPQVFSENTAANILSRCSIMVPFETRYEMFKAQKVQMIPQNQLATQPFADVLWLVAGVTYHAPSAPYCNQGTPHGPHLSQVMVSGVCVRCSSARCRTTAAVRMRPEIT